MKFSFLKRKIAIVAICIITAIVIFIRCTDATQQTIITNDKGEAFAGSNKCINCHKDIYDGFLHTAHHCTSQPVLQKTVKGNFSYPNNILLYSYYSRLAMRSTDSGFYQVLYNRDKEMNRYRMDMIIGSGVRGQSYLSWQGNELLQLPGSYFTTAHTWVNSPNFSIYAPAFNRIVNTRCLECHMTYIKDTSSNKFVSSLDKTQIIYGVQCERCHGPAEKHALYQEEHPAEKEAKYIYNLSRMTRQQKIDLCAYCHGGTRTDNKPAFDYTQGDTLTHLPVANVATSNAALDVHGNPYGLLAASKCFTHTETLQCTTCHNTHEEERGNLALFSARCMQCHKENSAEFCKMKQVPLSTLEKNCIDCHMPVKKSKMLTVENDNEKNMPATLRSHFISVYPEESKKFMQLMHEEGVNR